MLTKLSVGEQHRFGTEENAKMAKMLVEKLVPPAHTQRKLEEELYMQMVRSGPTQGKPNLMFLQYNGASDIAVWALKSWILEHYVNAAAAAAVAAEDWPVYGRRIRFEGDQARAARIKAVLGARSPLHLVAEVRCRLLPHERVPGPVLERGARARRAPMAA